MAERLSFEAEVIAEITALRMVVAQAVGLSALLMGKGSNAMEVMRRGAHDNLAKHTITAPGHDEQAVKLRAEFTIDQLFDSIHLNFPE